MLCIYRWTLRGAMNERGEPATSYRSPNSVSQITGSTDFEPKKLYPNSRKLTKPYSPTFFHISSKYTRNNRSNSMNNCWWLRSKDIVRVWIEFLPVHWYCHRTSNVADCSFIKAYCPWQENQKLLLGFKLTTSIGSQLSLNYAYDRFKGKLQTCALCP